MTNLVRGGVILSLLGLFATVFADTMATGNALSMTNEAFAAEVNTGIIEEEETEAVTDDKKKLVKKTVYEKSVVAPVAAAGTLVKSSAFNRGSFTATAYCLKGRTAMGHGVRRGIIAADPRVLRLGSRISLGAGAYSGQYLVSDTGGKIKGKKIDIWVANCAEARRFGRRTVHVGSL
ncbi:MAG: 3D domain-containing protein [Acidobacteria bacterium]|nr:3D domain-containing protein [Acidobacteriota bacterium]MCA1609188.1 3D domain-containing protein [Acidobacteriota bacterium]